MSCQAKDVHGNPCRNKGPFCKFHVYMTEYTPEMLAGCTLCKGCKKMKYKEMESCDECRALGAVKRKKAKAETEVVLCSKEGCKFKKSDDNKYCGKHQLFQFIDETAALGLKTCYNANRGCLTQMPMDGKSSCSVCLAKARDKDHKNRIVEPAKTAAEKQCTGCRKMHPLEAFNGSVGETKQCTACREVNKRADEKRDQEHVKELARKNSAKPERKAVKQAWREANYEKVTKYWMDARARLIEADLEGFLRREALRMKKWRDNNPEKMHATNQKKINSMNSQYGVYKSSAIAKQLEFEIKIDEYKSIVILPCHYCGIVQEKGFNGLDRTDSTVGYVTGNCVSCCEMCNYMKKCMSPDVFVKMTQHIDSYSKITDTFYPEIFKDTKLVRYSLSKLSALIRDIPFDVSKEIFDAKKQKCCYLCGKENSETHQNGIDRVDSSIGYVESNMQSCCGNCNIMKSNYTLESFLEKCTLVAMNHKPNEPMNQTVAIVKGNKLSKSEKKEIHDAKKEVKMKQLKERYSKEQIAERIQLLTSK